MKKTILAFAAHPDDLEFGCCITIKDLIKMGYEAHYVIATAGDNGFKGKNISKKKRIKVREKEQLEAAKATGVHKVYFWGFEDGFLKYNDALRKKITQIIKKVRPEIVFTFDPANRDWDNLNLLHRDHRIISEAVCDGVFAAKNAFIYKSKFEPHKVSKMLFFGSNKPDYFTDITDRVDEKMDIIHCHRSQFTDFDKFRKAFAEFFMRDSNKFKYSESFRELNVLTLT